MTDISSSLIMVMNLVIDDSASLCKKYKNLAFHALKERLLCLYDDLAHNQQKQFI